MKTQQMLRSHPSAVSYHDALAKCIDACFECAQCCTACADACLASDMVEQMRHCIRTDQDCADLCGVTGRVLSRQTEPDAATLRSLVEACRAACHACGKSCRSHADQHEHCRICGDCCKACEEACETLLTAMD